MGDAGQRVQGFLDKVGLTHSYVLVNAFPVAVHPGKVSKAQPLLEDDDQLAWRNRFYDLVTGPELEAIVAFGANAHLALDLWDEQAGRADLQGAAPLEPRHALAPGEVADRVPGPSCRGHSRPRRDAGRGQLRLHVQGVGLPARSPATTCPSGCRRGWATTPGYGATVRGVTTRSNDPASDQEHTLLWQAPTAEELTAQDRDSS